MKTIKNIILTAFISVALISCNDAIDIDPIGSLTDDVTFETVGDLQLGLNGAYARLNPENEIYFNSVFTDNVKPGCASGGQGIPLYNWLLTADNGDVRNIWNSSYSLINQCNRVIEASAGVAVTSASEQADLNNIVGQATALRAFAHFQMMQYFTVDATDDGALSIIIADKVPAIDEVFPRSTNGQVYAFIDADLNTAQSLLAPSQTDKIFVTQDFITALKARMAINRGQNIAAMGFAQTLIDAYPLANQSQYINMFFDTDDTEVIFKAVRTSADGLIGGLWYFTNSAGPFFEASNSLYNAHDPSDIRFAVNINFGTNNVDGECGPTDDANNVHLINKYPGNASPFLSDAKIFRVSEMHLIKAEAQARQTMLPQAAMTLQTLRDERFGAATALDSYGTTTEALDAVFDERRLELAYEGHRYLDMKRFGKGLNRDALDCAAGGSCILASSDFKFTFPIPQVEVNANPSIVQNPGYTN